MRRLNYVKRVCAGKEKLNGCVDHDDDGGGSAGDRRAGRLATGLLIVVAIVGVSLNLMYHAQLRPLPKPVIVIHGCVAVVAFILLLMAIMRPH
jgi:hypothetical protein